MMEDIALTFLQDLQAHGTPKDLDLLLVNTDGDDKSLTLKKLAQYVNTEITYPDATLNNKGITKLSNETNSNDETTAATPKAVTAAVKNATMGLAKKSTASLEPTGWFRDSDTGVIKQWGIVNRNGDTTRVTFPTQFPNACVNVQLTLRNSNAGGSTSNVFANNEDTQGFNYITASHEVQSFWMAIGY